MAFTKALSIIMLFFYDLKRFVISKRTEKNMINKNKVFSIFLLTFSKYMLYTSIKKIIQT